MPAKSLKRDARYRLQNDCLAHLRYVQGVEPHEHQIPVFEAVATKPKVIVSSAHNMGKSWIAARIVLWETPSFPRSKCLSTAPTMGQVRDILWSEIRAGYRDSLKPLGGDMQTVAWRLAADWFAKGVKPRDQADGGGLGQGTGSSFQGFKAGRRGRLRLIFEEATGILKQMWVQGEGMMTSANVFWFAICNPTSKASPAYEAWVSGLWHTIKLTCFQSPNLIANGITDLGKLQDELSYLRTLSDADRLQRLDSYIILVDYLLTTRWVMERAFEWGIDHPLFQSKALGEWPDEDEMALMSLGVVEGAMYREPDTDDQFVSIGVDCARFGTDKTVITTMIGHVVQKPKVLTKRRETVIAGEIMNLIKALPRVDCICVDATGIGAGVLDMLIENQMLKLIDGNTEIREVHFGGGFTEKDSLAEEDKLQYENIKSKVFVLLAKDLKTHIVLPNESVYSKELPTILYKFTRKGKYYIESKEEYKKRTGLGSPDHSDSLALANYGRSEDRAIGKFPPSTRDTSSEGGTIAGSLKSSENKW